MLDPRRVRMLYDEASALGTEEARAFLEEQCRGEPELLRELESLLGVTAELGGFLEERPAVAVHFGPYEALESLGRGGQGSVLRARHRESGEIVALKTVRDTSPTLLGSIRREIHTLAQMRHPCIVRVVDFGVARGAPWYAMELVEGTTLGSRMKEGGLAELLQIARRVCDPLAYLHGQGVVHRDLKPSNILIRPDGSPVLVDFGVASHLSGGGGRERMRVEGTVVGTLLYMAPEQIRGELVDARADLYALGCILFQMATGRPPFLAQDGAALIDMHLRAEPQPPSSLAAGISLDLERLILRLLAKSPRERLGYAADVASALVDLGARAEPAAPARSYLYRPRLVGRDGPMEELRARLHAAAGGGGGIVLLEGDAGTGKTRLLVEASREAVQSGMHVLSGEARARMPGEGAAAAPLHPIATAFAYVADFCRGLGPEASARVLGRRARRLATHVPSLAGLPGVEDAHEPSPLPPVEARLRLYADLAESLAALSADAPVLLVLDDLHLADELTLSFLAHLGRGTLQDQRLLILGAYRPSEAPEVLRALAGDVSRLPLTPLPEEPVAVMVADMLALHDQDGAKGLASLPHPGATPLLVTEYLRTAVWEQKLVRGSDGRWRTADGAPLGSLEIPDSIDELLERRAAGLPPPALRLAQAGAVLDRPFDLALAAAVGELDEMEALAAVEELLARQLLEELPGGRLRVVHEGVRRLFEGGLDPSERRRRHRACAGALGASAAPEELAYHLEMADESATARKLYLEAARNAASRHAHAESERLYRAFFRLDPEPGIERIEARLELGSDVLSRQGRRAEGAAQVEMALAEAEALGDAPSIVRSLRSLGYLRHVMGRPDEAMMLLARAVEGARARGDLRSERVALEQLGIVHQEMGRLEEAEALHRETLDLGRRASDRLGQANALANLATLNHQRRRPDVARSLYEEALRELRHLGEARLQGISLGNLAALHLEQGRLPDAEELYRSAIALAREVGNRWAEAMALGNLAMCRHQQLGADARGLYEQALRLARAIGDPRLLGPTQLGLATLDFEEGRVDAARAACDAILAAPATSDDKQLRGATACLLAMLVRLSGGPLEAAEERCLEAAALCDGVGDRLEGAKCRCELGHVRIAQGRDADAILADVEATARELAVGPASELSRCLERLRRAQEAARNGRPLHRGSSIADVPTALRPLLPEDPAADVRPE